MENCKDFSFKYCPLSFTSKFTFRNQHLSEESEFKECITCKSDSNVIFINVVHSSFVGLDLMETVKMKESPVKEEVKKPIAATKANKIKTFSVPSNITSIKDFFEVIHLSPKMECDGKHEIVEILEPSIDQQNVIKVEYKPESIDAFLLNIKKRLSFFEAPMKAKFPKTIDIEINNDDIVENVEIPETQSSSSVNELQLKYTPGVHQLTNLKDTDDVLHIKLKQELIVNEDFRDLDSNQQLEVWSYLKPSFVKKRNNLEMMDSTLFKMKFNRINKVLQLYQKKNDLPERKLIVKVSPEIRIRNIPKPLIPWNPIVRSTISEDPQSSKKATETCELFKSPVTTVYEFLNEMLPKLQENKVLNEIYDSYVKEDSILDLENHGNVSKSKDFIQQQLNAETSQVVENKFLNDSLQYNIIATEKINLVDDNFAKDFLASMDDEEKTIKSSMQINGIFKNTPSLSETARKIKKSQLMLTGLKVCENIVMKILEQNDEDAKEINGCLDFLFEQSLQPVDEAHNSKDEEGTTNRRINFKEENKDISFECHNLNVTKPKAKVSSTSRAIGELQLLHEKFRLTRSIQLSTSNDNSGSLFIPSGSGLKKLQLHQNNNSYKEMSIKEDEGRQAKHITM